MSFPFPSMYQFTFTFQTLVIWSQNVIIGYKWSGPQKILHPIKNLEQWFRITHWCWEWMPYLFLFSYFSIYCMCQPKRLQANGRLLSQMHSPRHPCGTPRKKNIYIKIANIAAAVISNTIGQFCIGKSQKNSGKYYCIRYIYVFMKIHIYYLSFLL